MPDFLAPLVTLTAMEIILGIDNIVFLSILTGKLPASQQPRARAIGMGGALGFRILLLLGISFIMKLTAPFFAILGHSFSGRDLILLGGGLFLIAKSTFEVYEKVEAHASHSPTAPKSSQFAWLIFQIILLDIVFSLDSVITAVGMAQDLWIMVVAMTLAVAVMFIFAGAIGRFVDAHPSVKILALSFLLLIGVVLLMEGMGQHIERGYIYFAMAFSLSVELLNMRYRKKQKVVGGNG